MPWDVTLHVLLRAVTAALALAAFVLGARRALRMRYVGIRRTLRMVGAVVVLGYAALSAIDAGHVGIDGKVPESALLDWFWVGLDVLIPVFFLLLIRAWRERDALEAKLAALSVTDPLTGLSNRRGFLGQALPAITITRRHDRPCAVIMLDVDRFKAINDGWGHAAGDAVLTGVATAMTETVRHADVIGRLGGEEFALLLPGADEASALATAERLRRHITDGVAHPGPGAVTVSAGIAILSDAGEPEAALTTALAAADAALYAAKIGGRDQVRVAGERPFPTETAEVASGSPAA